ncbi:MAG: UDP-forming cellulose synthase catalytic subunit [Alphaproteobacteria bacterium]
MVPISDVNPPKWALLPAFLLGLFVAIVVVTTPLEPHIQALVGLVVVVGAFIAGRIENRLVLTILTVMGFMFASRYMYWRVTETLDFDTFLAWFFGLGLYAAELYLWVILAITFVQSIWPLERKPVPLPDDTALWPTIDLYIPTYNEELDLVAKTVYAAKDLEYPPEKLQIYLLDDGRRDEFRDFAARAGIGYVTRDTNEHAKAGNLNNALRQTDGELVAILDCDHIPTRWFLQLTAGWFLQDPDMALVQTPHHFYNRDPFLKNLSAGTRVPPEGLLFYGLVQDGNDFWNAAFFCGSCALLRRDALEGIGGIAVETVTEDAHTALKLHRAGWKSAFIRFPMAAGLATETLGRFIGQRIRWARGMVQILRLDSPLLGPGLSLPQRICYLSAMMHFLFPLPRFVLLTAPLAFLIMDIRIIEASASEVFTYALPYLVLIVYVNWRIQGRFRHSFWSDVYETSLTLHLLWPTVKTFIKPRGGRFKVTSKGGGTNDTYFDGRLMIGHMLMVAVLAVGVLLGLYNVVQETMLLYSGTLTEPLLIQETQDQIGSTFLNILWATVSLTYFSAALATAREAAESGVHLVRAEMPVVVWLEDGRSLAGTASQLSEGEFYLNVPRPAGDIGSAIHIDAEAGNDRVVVSAQIASWDSERLAGQFTPSTEEEEAALVRLIYGRGDAWVDWDQTIEATPLQSAGEIYSSIGTFFRWGGDRIRHHTYDRVNHWVRPTAPSVQQRKSAKTILENAMREAAGQRSALLIAGLAASLFTLFAAQAPVARAQETPQETRSQEAPLLPGLPRRLEPIDQPSESRRPTVTTRPAPSIFDQPSARRRTDGLPPQPTVSDDAIIGIDITEPAELLERGDNTRRIVLTLRDLGAEPSIQLRNGSVRGIPFQVRSDEVITEAQVSLNMTFSPSLLSGRSYVVVQLNGEGIGTVDLDPTYGTTRTVQLNVDPYLVKTNNELLFEFIGEGSDSGSSCPGSSDQDTWVKIGHLSKISMAASRFRVRNELSRLPQPFFDPSDPTKLVLPFVLDENPSATMLRAAGIVASYWGHLADFRGAYFPVSQRTLPSSNAIVFGRPNPGGGLGIPWPNIDGPTLAIVDNPGVASAKLLLVMGRTDAEILEAAQALSAGTIGLSGSVMAVSAPAIEERKIYDAPRWLPTNGPVMLGSRVPQERLEGRGLTPGSLTFNFRTSPDIFLWSDNGIPVTVNYRYSAGPWIDAKRSRLDILINDVYVDSLPLEKDSFQDRIDRITLNDTTMNQGTVKIPLFQIGGQNQLQFFFDLQPVRDDNECVDVVPKDLRSVIDVTSEIDLSPIYRQTRMPNLAFLTQSGFPFTRYADLSETAIIIPNAMRRDEIEAVLALMGLFGARTGYPGFRVQILNSDEVNEGRDKDLILVGSWERQPLLRRWSEKFGFERRENTVVVPGAREIGPSTGSISNWVAEAGLLDQVSVRIASLKSGMVSFRSPLNLDRTVVGLFSSEGSELRQLVNALTSPDLNPQVQGDLVTVQGDTVTSYRVTDRYYVGRLPFLIWLQWFLSDKPVAMIGLAGFAGLLLGFPIFTWLRSSAARARDQ